jgi:hypothetical protein
LLLRCQHLSQTHRMFFQEMTEVYAPSSSSFQLLQLIRELREIHYMHCFLSAISSNIFFFPSHVVSPIYSLRK